MKIAILGAGAWGTALAINFCRYHQIILWTKDTKHFTDLAAKRINQHFLPGFHLPDSVQLTATLETAIATAELVIIVVPVAGLRETLRAIVATGKIVPIIWGCKGFESEAARLPYQIVKEEYAEIAPSGVLSGPSFAQEVAQGLPTALTLASHDETFLKEVSVKLHSSRLRIYSTSDVIGVETGGAVKNVIAIAVGISDGMDFGYNARAALITRGLLEINRLGVKLGGRMETFMGLSGLGDLILTCTGDLSRNRQIGMMLARGRSLTNSLQRLGHVAEGVSTALEAQRLGIALEIEMPITQAVCNVLYEGMPAREAVEGLLSRGTKNERY